MAFFRSSHASSFDLMILSQIHLSPLCLFPKQNKSATEVYEQATNCPVAGSAGKIWQEYTQFLEERGRPKTAQKIYLRALVGEGGEGGVASVGPMVTDPNEQETLWNGFLSMMQSLRKNPNLSMEDLKTAIQKEHLGQSTTLNDGTDDQMGGTQVPDQQASSATAANNNQSSNQDTEEEVARPAKKRSRWGTQAPVETETVSASSIDTASGILVTAAKNMPPEIETLWHARDGGSLPSRPEPPLFTASPPKLGDPSGKDLVGNETALKILKMLTAKTHDGKCLGSAILELCHACWMMTALKEETVVNAEKSLQTKIAADRETMEADLDARASVAGGAIEAVQQANDKERNSFEQQAQAQRNQLQSSIAWEFRKLLYTQQILLASAKLVGFQGPTVDSTVITFQSKVCSVMHSAFYLRARVGETSHVNMLNKQLESLQTFISTAVKQEPVDQQPQFQAPFHLSPQFAQPPVFAQPPQMYTGQIAQPMTGLTPILQQATMLPGYQQPQLMVQGQQLQPQQYLATSTQPALNQQQFNPGQP